MSRNALGIEWSSGGVRWAMAEAGVWAPILFTVLPVFRLFLVIPSVILLPAGGLLFGGAVEGAIYGTIGPTISGLLNSLLAFCFRMTRTRRDTMRCHPSHKQVRADRLSSRSPASIAGLKQLLRELRRFARRSPEAAF